MVDPAGGLDPYWSRVHIAGMDPQEVERVYENELARPFRPDRSVFFGNARRSRERYMANPRDPELVELPPALPTHHPVVERLSNHPPIAARLRGDRLSVAWVPVDALLAKQTTIGLDHAPAPDPRDRDAAYRYAFPLQAANVDSGSIRWKRSVVTDHKLQYRTRKVERPGSEPKTTGFLTSFHRPLDVIRVRPTTQGLLLVNGHHRCIQFHRAGWEEVPVILLDGEPPKDGVLPGASKWYRSDIHGTPFAPRLLDFVDDEFSTLLPVRRSFYRYEVQVEVDSSTQKVPDEAYAEGAA